MVQKSRGRDVFNKYALLINFLVRIVQILPRFIRMNLFFMFRNKNGLSGLGIRYILLKTLSKKVGSNVSIHPAVYIFNPERLEIGNNVSIHPMCYIEAEGKVVIGNDVSIAHGTTILSTTHQYKDVERPIKDQGIELNQTTIEDNVWIGSKVTILDGLTIEAGSVIAASAVVTKDVKTNSVVAGIPAKTINMRM